MAKKFNIEINQSPISIDLGDCEYINQYYQKNCF